MNELPHSPSSPDSPAIDRMEDRTMQVCGVCGLFGHGVLDSCAVNDRHTLNCGQVVFVRRIANAICARCGQVQNDPMPDEADLADIYARMSRRVTDGVRHDGRSMPIEQVQAAFVRAHTAPRSVLDIGCGMGGFLRCFGDDVHRMGCEPSEADAEVARRGGLAVVPRIFRAEDYTEASFDCIALRFVFEHLLRPIELLRDVKPLLTPGGTVFIEVPDLAHPFIGLDDFFSFGHTFTFSAATLAHAAAKAGYSVRALESCDNHALAGRSFPSLRMLIEPAVEAPLPPGDHAAESRRLVALYLNERCRLIERVAARLDHAAVRGAQRVVIYGAGTHSAELTTAFPWLLEHCTAFVDGNRALQGFTYLGRPVHAPDALHDLAPDRIIISAREAEPQILAFLTERGFAAQAVPLYAKSQSLA